ncbi:MAG: hypothetical protein Q8928_06235 [Bacteroidota bacterium]|nr:hypothetical protein [Bacteroidota bacterium]
MTIRNILLILFLCPLSLGLFAQSSPQEEARQLFENGDYAQALPKFKRLLTLFPKDAGYHYYTGVCMVQTNYNLLKSIEYLTFASNKNVPVNCYFFLGKAYHYLYRFDDAILAYQQFKQKASRQEIEKLECNRQIEMAENGKKLIAKQGLFNVYQTDSIKKEDLINFYNKKLKNGTFQKKQVKELPFLKGQTIWRYISSGDKIFESAFVSKNNRDLVVVGKATGKNKPKPENLGSTINTAYDEDYAWFNNVDSTLYFSSKGHNSMGGYDIFKSKYNPHTKRWSEPVNLGFPINSPYDDILFVPSEDSNQVCFASNRNTNDSKLTIYTISYFSNYTYADIVPNTDLVSISNFNTQQQRSINQPIINNKKVLEIKSDNKWLINNINATTYPDNLSNNTEYNQILTSALRFQVQSDSFFRKADDLRQKALVQNNETEKSRLKKEAYSLEIRSKDAQKNADDNFAKAQAFESGISSDNNVKDSIPAVTDDLAKKAFGATTKNTRQQDKEKNNTSKKSTPTPSSSKIIYEFKVMNSSPYKTLNDIPLNQTLPQDIIFRVQMGAFSKTIEPDRFNGIIPIYGETIPNSLVVKYYAGLFNRFSDAEKALNKIREYGFKDAYIVSYYNGKSIPLSRAKEMQKDLK